MSSTAKKVFGGVLAGLLALFAAVVVATPAVADDTASALAIGNGGVVSSADGLAGALNAATSDSQTNVVTLNDDVTLTKGIAITASGEGGPAITLNLSGHKLEVPGIMVTAGTLTVQDTVGNGSINWVNGSAADGYVNGYEGRGGDTINVSGTGNLVVESGTINGPGTEFLATGSSWRACVAIRINANVPQSAGGAASSENASITIKGGTVNNSNGVAAINSFAGKLTMSGGTVVGGGAGINGEGNEGAVAICGTGTMQLTGGSISNPSGQTSGTGIQLQNSADLTMSNGNVTGVAFGIATNGSNNSKGGNNITISGGTVTGGDDNCGIYLPAASDDSGANADTCTIKGGTITGGAGIISLGSKVEVTGGSITATSTEPVRAGDAKVGGAPDGAPIQYVPSAIVMAAETNYAQPSATNNLAVSGVGTTLSSAEGVPSVAYQSDDYNADNPDQSSAGKTVISVTGGSFTSPVPNDYLNDVNILVTGNGYNSYFEDSGTADIYMQAHPGTTEQALNAATVEFVGFAPTNAEARAAVNAEIDQYGSGNDVDWGTTTNNIMWARVKAAPLTNVTVSFFTPGAKGAAVAANATSTPMAFQQVGTTGETGYMWVSFNIGGTGTLSANSTVNAKYAVPGVWTVTAVVGGENPGNPGTSNDAGNVPVASEESPVSTANVTLASVVYNLNDDGAATISDVAKVIPQAIKGNSDDDTTYTFLYNAASGTAPLATVAPTLAKNVYLGWYEVPTTGDPTAAPETITLAGATAKPTPYTTTITAGYVPTDGMTLEADPSDEITTPRTIVAGQPVDYTLTLTLPKTVTTSPKGISVTADSLVTAAPAIFKTLAVQVNTVYPTVTAGTATAAENGVTVPVTVQTKTNYTNAGKPASEGITVTFALGVADSGSDGVDSTDFESGAPVAKAQNINFVKGITVTTQGNGTVAQTVNADGNIVLTATPINGATFVSWQNQYGVVISTSNPLVVSAGSYSDGGLTAVFEGGSATPETNVAVTVLYNKWNGDHMFTTNPDEVKGLENLGWDNQGTAWYAPSTGVAVYRLYNPYSYDHYWCTSDAEAAQLETLGWQREGIGFYGATNSTYPVYQLFNPYVTQGTHYWTTSISEYNNLIQQYSWEGNDVSWSAAALTK